MDLHAINLIFLVIFFYIDWEYEINKMCVDGVVYLIRVERMYISCIVKVIDLYSYVVNAIFNYFLTFQNQRIFAIYSIKSLNLPDITTKPRTKYFTLLETMQPFLRKQS